MVEETEQKKEEEEESGEETTALIEQQSKRIEELETAESERIKADAKKQLDGKAEAGGEKEKPVEETDKEYKDKVMSGR